MHTTKQEAQLHNSRKPGSLCTIPINPVNSLSRPCAGNQHLSCKLAPQNMMFQCSESVRVFCLHSGSSSCSRIPVTFQVVRNDPLSVATETYTAYLSLPFLGPPWMLGLRLQVHVRVRTHTQTQSSIRTHLWTTVWPPLPQLFFGSPPPTGLRSC